MQVSVATRIRSLAADMGLPGHGLVATFGGKCKDAIRSRAALQAGT